MPLEPKKSTSKTLYNYNTKSKKEIVPVSVIIPAYNEESTIGATLSSLLEQSVIPKQIIVVDDSSSDRTSEIASRFDGVNVVRTEKNSGSKGHALNYGLSYSTSKYTITIDADITIEYHAIEKMVKFMEARPDIVATSTFVIPNKIKTVWEHTRFVEYLFALSFYKAVQQMYDGVVICSGCFTIYITQELKSIGGWPSMTVAEDMELTWAFYEDGKHIGYNSDVMCYAKEPDSLRLLSNQLKRWNTGFFQVLKLKWKHIYKLSVVREFVIGGLIDSLVGSILYGVIIFFSIYYADPSRFLLFILLDIVMLSIPSFWIAFKIKKPSQLVKSLPYYLLFRYVGIIWWYYGLISVLILRRGVIKFEKGH